MGGHRASINICMDQLVMKGIKMMFVTSSWEQIFTKERLIYQVKNINVL